MIYSIIQKSQLEGALRLDAEYYQPEYLNLISKIKSQKSKLLKEFAEKVFSGPFGSTLKSESYQSKGIPFIRIGDISDVFISRENLVYISESENKRIFSTHLNPGDIVFSKIGTIGRLSVISEDLGQVNISENNIGIRFSKLSPQEKVGLLFFLLSKYGQLQILRSASGNIQQKLNVADIESVKVSIFSTQFQQELWNSYEKITKLRKQGESLYFQAENLLLGELGLTDFKEENELFSIVKLSDVKSAKRMDAEYFQPKYNKLISRIKNQNAKLLPDIIENVPARFNPQNQPEKSFKYVELANINSSIGVIDGFSEVTGRETPSRAKRVLKAGDVIVSSVEGSLGKVALVNKGQDGYLASTGFFQFRSKEILPEVLLVLAKSLIFQVQLEKQCAGTILTAVPKEAIKNVLAPILPKSIQQKIADLVQKSHEARKQAKELLEEAKTKVEETIGKKSD